jgi:transposase
MKVVSVREQEGLTLEQASQRFGVGIASLARWLKNIIPQETRDKPATKIDMIALAQDVEKHPDAYQYERAERLGVCTQCVNYALRRLDITYKKNATASTRSRRRAARLPRKNRSL